MGRARGGASAPPDTPSNTQPLVTRLHDGRREVIAAACPAAQAVGLRPGMPLAQARAQVPDLHVADADLDGDAAALRRLAAWCLRLSPLCAPDPPDGVWLDIAGCAHLHAPEHAPGHALGGAPREVAREAGERGLLRALLARLAGDGIAARAAVAGTPGAAHAVARHADERLTVVPPGGEAAALAPLPVRALRLDPEAAEALRRLGLERVKQLAAAPRAPLARRFGMGLLLRLDQALGRAAEAIEPALPPEQPGRRLAFAEPLLGAEQLSAAILRLVPPVCAALERAGLGARRLDLLFERVDGVVQAVRIGTARPSRDPRHLARLLDERLETVDPGLGVEAMRLAVPLAEPLAYAQASLETALASRNGAEPDLAALVDRLGNRLGTARVRRPAPVESDVPERSVVLVPPLVPSEPGCPDWPSSLPRPVRLLEPPEPVRTIYDTPDHPPIIFIWRRHTRRIRRADGPERIQGEWWRSEQDLHAVRDYWCLEDEAGRRWWLYRRGDGQHDVTGDLAWFLHGVF